MDCPATSPLEASEGGEQVYVLLPVHNRQALTLSFVRSLMNQSFSRFTLILIDDGSTDGTAATVRTVLPATVVITGQGDWWWAESLNQGVRWLRQQQVAEDALVLIANDDTVLETNFLSRAVQFMAEHPRTLLLARHRENAQLPAEETGIHFDVRTWQHRIARQPDEINCLPTRDLFLRWGDMQVIGGFRPGLLPHYFSDYEFTMRAHRLGFILVTHPDIAISANMETTGFHEFTNLAAPGQIGRLFSKKSAANPLYASIFAMLVSPPRYVLLNVMRIWWRGLRRVRKMGTSNDRAHTT